MAGAYKAHRAILDAHGFGPEVDMGGYEGGTQCIGRQFATGTGDNGSIEACQGIAITRLPRMFFADLALTQHFQDAAGVARLCRYALDHPNGLFTGNPSVNGPAGQMWQDYYTLDTAVGTGAATENVNPFDIRFTSGVASQLGGAKREWSTAFLPSTSTVIPVLMTNYRRRRAS